MDFARDLGELSVDDQKEIIQLVGPSIKELDAEYADYSEFAHFLQYFPNLRKLEFEPNELFNDQSMKTFPRLQSLSLFWGPSPKCLNKLFRHLSPTLIHLDMNFDNHDGFMRSTPLHNLQSIGIPIEMMDQHFLRFWKLNKQLTKLRLRLTPRSEIDGSFLEALTDLKDLDLSLDDENEEPNYEFLEDFPSIPSLESFTIRTTSGDALGFILPQIGPQLKSLTIDCENWADFDLPSALRDFLDLERLEFNVLRFDDEDEESYDWGEEGGFGWDEEDEDSEFDCDTSSCDEPFVMWDGPILEALKYLKIRLGMTYTIRIIRAMPNLEELVNDQIEVTDQLLRYLKGQKQTLRFNNSKGTFN